MDEYKIMKGEQNSVDMKVREKVLKESKDLNNFVNVKRHFGN